MEKQKLNEAFTIVLEWITNPKSVCPHGCDECELEKFVMIDATGDFYCPITDLLPSAIKAFFGQITINDFLVEKFRQKAKTQTSPIT